MKVALIHDFLIQFGGAERTLKVMHEIWPEAPIYTTFYDPKKMGKHFEGVKIYQSSLAGWPLVGRFYKTFSFLYPLIFESFDLNDFDVIISSSASFAKGVITKPHQLHICYCYTPPRFLYHYSTETNYRSNPIFQVLLAPLDQFLRLWDFWAAQRVDKFVAISETVKERIKKFYRRDSVVIYPPVPSIGNLERSHLPPLAAGVNAPNTRGFLTGATFFLVVSRLARYKNIDLAIKACNNLGLSLKVIGTGREENNLKKMAGSTIEFLGEANDEQLADYYQNCQAVIVPTSDEDFGLVPLEANSFGKPVIALRSGGMKEIVIEGKTGLFFENPTKESLSGVLKVWSMARKWDKEFMKEWAGQFSEAKFKEKLGRFVEEEWAEKLKG